jgi:hypothetical protein
MSQKQIVRTRLKFVSYRTTVSNSKLFTVARPLLRTMGPLFLPRQAPTATVHLPHGSTVQNSQVQVAVTSAPKDQETVVWASLAVIKAPKGCPAPLASFHAGFATFV